MRSSSARTTSRRTPDVATLVDLASGPTPPSSTAPRPRPPASAGPGRSARPASPTPPPGRTAATAWCSLSLDVRPARRSLLRPSEERVQPGVDHRRRHHPDAVRRAAPVLPHPAHPLGRAAHSPARRHALQGLGLHLGPRGRRCGRWSRRSAGSRPPTSSATPSAGWFDLGRGTSGTLVACAGAAYFVRDPATRQDPAALLRWDPARHALSTVFTSKGHGNAFLSPPRCGGDHLTVTAFSAGAATNRSRPRGRRTVGSDHAGRLHRVPTPGPRLLRRPRGRQHPVVLGQAQGHLRLLRPTTDGRPVRGAGARVRGGQGVPAVPRRALRQGQDAVQDRAGRVRRRRPRHRLVRRDLGPRRPHRRRLLRRQRTPDRRHPGGHRRRPHRARAPVTAREARGRRLARSAATRSRRRPAATT